MKEIDIQLQETQRVPNKMNAKRPTQRHIIIKMPKVKDKERSRRRKAVSYSEWGWGTGGRSAIRLSAHFSKETLQARCDWQEIFKVMKRKDLQQRLLYPAKLDSHLLLKGR